MTALSELLRALRTENTLPWLLVYAPDGNPDAAAQRAWKRAKSKRLLVDLLLLAHRRPLPWLDNERADANALRLLERCPTWDQLCGGL